MKSEWNLKWRIELQCDDLLRGIFGLISIHSFITSACVFLLPPPHTAPQWSGVERRAEDHPILSRKGCVWLLGYWARGRGSGLHGYKREEVDTCCIQLAVFMHSKFITARSFEIPSYFYNAVMIRIFSICVSLAGCLFFSWRKVLPVPGHGCLSLLFHKPTHTHTHRIVGGRGETLWSGLRSLQLSWCTLTDLCSQERERKMEVEDVERCLNAFFLSLRNAKLQPCHNDASATLNSRNH